MQINIRDIPVYYINLDSDVLRDRKTKKLLSSLGFKNVNRISAVKDKSHADGCAKSHMSIIKDQLSKDEFSPFIIVEDDIDTTSFFDLKMLDIDVPEDADALYLGIDKWGVPGDEPMMDWMGMQTFAQRTENKRMHKVINMLSTHAILHLTRDYSERAFKAWEDSIGDRISRGGDVLLAYHVNRNMNVYGLNFPIFYQADMRRPHMMKNTHINVSSIILK